MQPVGRGGNHGAHEVVSILIQPEGRMQRVLCAGRIQGNRRVSILIQPEGRMQPNVFDFHQASRPPFQSSSSPRAGCNATPSTAPRAR